MRTKTKGPKNIKETFKNKRRSSEGGLPFSITMPRISQMGGRAATKEGGKRESLSNVALVGASCCLPGLDYRRAELIIMMMMTMLAKKKTGSTKAGFIRFNIAYQINIDDIWFWFNYSVGSQCPSQTSNWEWPIIKEGSNVMSIYKTSPIQK